MKCINIQHPKKITSYENPIKTELNKIDKFKGAQLNIDSSVECNNLNECLTLYNSIRQLSGKEPLILENNIDDDNNSIYNSSENEILIEDVADNIYVIYQPYAIGDSMYFKALIHSSNDVPDDYVSFKGYIEYNKNPSQKIIKCFNEIAKNDNDNKGLETIKKNGRMEFNYL